MSVDVAVPAAAFAEDDELPSSELPDDAVIPELSELPDDCAPYPELLSELPELSELPDELLCFPGPLPFPGPCPEPFPGPP